jgi:opacity protein-like surface antigen
MLVKTRFVIVPLIAALMFAVTPNGVSAGERIGMYVAPKFNIGFMNWRTKAEADANMITAAPPSNLTKSYSLDEQSAQTVVGGALAAGYDFYRNFKVPVRAELEYGVYSNASGSVNSSLSSNGLAPGAWGNNPVGINADMKLSMNIQTLMLNLYYDFRNSTPFTPYVGGGVGLAFIQAWGAAEVNTWDNTGGGGAPMSSDVSLGAKHQTNFAWQVGVGCSYDFNDYVALDLGYRFMGLGNVETQEGHMYRDVAGVQFAAPMKGKAENIHMHQIGLGLRVTF